MNMSEDHLDQVLKRGHLKIAGTQPAKKAKGSKVNKFRSVKVKIDGIKFDSKLEGAYYLKLLDQQAAGEVDYFHRQIPIRLTGGIVYRVDFQVFYTSGNVSYQDTKGIETDAFKLKMKLIPSSYPMITIELIRVVESKYMKAVDEIYQMQKALAGKCSG